MGALVPWHWLASSALHPLSRCCAAEIQQALLAVLAGEAFLADKPCIEIWWGRMQLDLASGWQLQIAFDRDRLEALMWARSPDGREWEYGCQHDDWTLGPDSRIVEPVALLEPEQRQQLERLLREAICWPAPLVTCGWVVPMGNVKPSPYARRGGRHQVHRPVTSAGRGQSARPPKTGSSAPTPL